MNQTPLKLYWWNAKPNFGDALSQLVTAHASGRAVVHAEPRDAEVFAVGSILQFARRVWGKEGRPSHRPTIWGTGMLGALRTDFVEHVDVAMLRGPITASLLGLKVESYGDPGVLTSEALGKKPEQHDRIGLVLHHGQLGHPSVKALLKSEPSVEYIDVQGTPEEVCPKIGACKHVISSSLHGLIVADSYGVPNTWLDPLKQPRMKYYDYAAGIGRVLPLPLKHDDIKAALPAMHEGALPYAASLAEAKQRLISDFPAHLRAGA
ncbi:polysaccharide pyruvyl transferase family protein [Lentibacter algarum]|uniref:polysaccharide pyruvyl transferase family protein n=1 Tax=Lentibacter algarum TaxID=576131 RepID=UPI001C06BE19|nr:polysaccharide pyruvyl transferase family protein [Lentibacter algarum]MBU2982318.1 polysaccharide pyruvyl transferase family protein [Lentibacter algarum]